MPGYAGMGDEVHVSSCQVHDFCVKMVKICLFLKEHGNDRCLNGARTKTPWSNLVH